MGKILWYTFDFIALQFQIHPFFMTALTFATVIGGVYLLGMVAR